MDFKREVEDGQNLAALTSFIKTIPARYENGEIDQELEQVSQEWNAFQQNSKREKKLRAKRSIQITSSFVAALFLFIAAAFVSPTVAQVASKIPYLNLLIDYQTLLEEIHEKMDENHYLNPEFIVSVDNGKKEVTVMVTRSKEYFQQVEKPVYTLIEDILKSRGNEDFKIVMKNDPEIGKDFDRFLVEHEKEVIEETKRRDDIWNALREIMLSYGYQVEEVVGLGSKDGEIELVNIPYTEARIEEIKTKIIETLHSAQMGKFTVNVSLYDPVLVDRGNRLMPIYETISSGLTAKTDEFKVDTVGVSNKSNSPFYIEIQTTVSASDKNSRKVVKSIKQTIQEFIQSSEVQEKVKEDKYKIVIKSKEGKEMDVIKN
ncbi:DUF4030 domain-containing protein [Bacillus sp. BGMRC 2118]|nr:DUF4030 domain-containing protein [Bacillus sp. BGMRC 2118]